MVTAVFEWHLETVSGEKKGLLSVTSQAAVPKG